MEENLHFEIDWDSLIVASKFTVFALFYFLFEGNFPNTSPKGAYFWRGDLTEGFLHYDFGGLIFGAAYTWRGLFSEFYGIHVKGKGSALGAETPRIKLFRAPSHSGTLARSFLRHMVKQKTVEPLTYQ